MSQGWNLFNALPLLWLFLWVWFSGWQVTKKLVSAKKNHGTQEFYNAAQTAAKRQSDREQNLQFSPKVHQTLQIDCNPKISSSPDQVAATPTATTAIMTSQHPPPKQNAPSKGSTPGSASKRRHRKLAVNFEAAKVSEWGGFLSRLQTSSMWTFLHSVSGFRSDTKIRTIPPPPSINSGIPAYPHFNLTLSVLKMKCILGWSILDGKLNVV